MRILALLLAVSFAADSLMAQSRRLPAQVTTPTRQHQQSVVSPDGASVAFVEAQQLWVVSSQGGTPLLLDASGSPLVSFVWAPDSRHVHYTLANGEVRSVPRAGGVTIPIAQPAGSSARVWCTDSRGTRLFGTRVEGQPRRYHLFWVPTLPLSQTIDVTSTADEATDLSLDPSDAYLLWRAKDLSSQLRFWRIDVNGQNPIDLAGRSLGSYAETPRWADNGDLVVFAGRDASGATQVMRLDRRTRAVVPLTGSVPHLRCDVSFGSRWIGFSSNDPWGGNAPAILPIEGGGLVHLETAQPYHQYRSEVTLDAAGTMAVATLTVLGQFPQVLRFDLDGEMRVHPRAELGQPLHFDLPAAPHEVGVTFLGLSNPSPFALPGVAFDFELQLGFAILTIAPGQSGVPIRATLPIPDVAALAGLRLFFQGLRYDPAAQSGEFTRTGEFTVFTR